MPTSAGAGLARTCLGVVRALDRRGVNVGFVKPVAQPRADGGPDRSTALVAATTALRPPEPLSTVELEHHLGAGGLDLVLEKVVATVQPVHDRSDVVVVEGLSPGPTTLYASGLNQVMAQALDADVVLVGSWPAAGAGRGGPVRPTADPGSGPGHGRAPGRDARHHRGRVLVGRAGPGGRLRGQRPAGRRSRPGDRLADALDPAGLHLIGAVPHRPELTWLRVLDLAREMRPRVLNEGDLSRRIKAVAVFAQGVPGGLDVLTDGRLVVVPGDRHDVVMAVCLAALNGTRLAALLLTIGVEPDPRVWELTRAACATGLPILVVDDHSYETATRVRDLDPGLAVDDRERTEGVMDSIAEVLDPSWLESLPSSARSRRLSPAAFRHQLVERARAADACVVLPEGTEPRTVQAAVACAERGIARCVLLGAPDEVAGLARSLGLRLPDGVTVVDPQAVADRYVAPLGHCGGTAAGPRTSPGTTSPIRSWSAP